MRILGVPGLCLTGLVASIDPARAGVKQAVEDANGGGIRVRSLDSMLR